ncbi:MAG: hypothetical protein KAI67_05085 [Candidatus Pacebacteria bacterium]|nr:hypothetical protein [Candidatus Paceibacterota bacterium]
MKFNSKLLCLGKRDEGVEAIVELLLERKEDDGFRIARTLIQNWTSLGGKPEEFKYSNMGCPGELHSHPMEDGRCSRCGKELGAIQFPFPE